ncbi:repressor LexA [Candidatus Peregrinibacteria bacterium CG10_big_fil_rev_8_21_14_0_10_49_16]|nr:MAG: repressor LexA [Candidatus Peregrinibacteria bacterium CG22_combo_CG10-13_8_21_14_all_49_11]PIR52014.1 MAG: repressor LexA [Candidatus Peregrinibacteria bacterium CG10_big_fil_rev_8_21_14_0_10_49_16]
MSLTDHQRTVFNYISEFQQKNGYTPSLSDLAIAFGVRSKNAIAKVVNALVREGYIQKDPKGRIKILEPEREQEYTESFVLPLFGPIAAGPADDAQAQVEDTIAIQEYVIAKPSSTFLLRVRGDSMVDAGIMEGDLVIVEKSAEPKVCDIVVGVLDGEFTLKRLMKNKGKYYLQAENAAYPDMYAADSLEVAGVVRGVVRKY